jgi:methyl-accepting chemotaxis protein
MKDRTYALWGAVFGVFFPVGGTVLQAILAPTGVDVWASLAHVQRMPLMWIIDTAPVFLGLLAGLAGHRHDQLMAAEESRRTAFGETARELFRSAQALLTATSSFSALTVETAASARQTSEIMNRLAGTAERAAQTAGTMGNLADASQQCSEDGLIAVRTAVEEMVRLTGAVRGLSDRIKGLNANMRDLGGIAALVGSVTDQSQRLAAAASSLLDRTPAASAFSSVVAEMQRHSESARDSAQRVRRILGEASGATAAAVAAAEDGIRRAEHGAKVAGATGAIIQKLAAALRDSSTAAKEISNVTRLQDRGFAQVQKAMQELDRATEEASSGTKQVESGARALNALARRLVESGERVG